MENGTGQMSEISTEVYSSLNEENRRTVAAFAEKMKRQATVYTDDDFSETDASDIINN